MKSIACKAAAASLAVGSSLVIAGQAEAQIVTQAGGWENTTFGSTGDLFIDFTLDGPNYSFTIDVDGGVFGAGNPDPFGLMGTRELDGSVIIDVQDDLFWGDITGKILATGVLEDVLFSDIPAQGIDTMTLDGTVAIVGGSSGTYEVFFTQQSGGGSAVGVWQAATTSVTDVPEPTSLALLGLGGLLVARRRRL